MTQKEKQLLLKDLCARLPYGVKVQIKSTYTDDEHITVFNSDLIYLIGIKSVKPCLRSMSSMTEEEKEELFQLMGCGTDVKRIDFYISHHFDYRGLIPMGLALEAPEGMYNTDLMYKYDKVYITS